MDQTIKDSVAWLKDLAHPGAHLRLDSREVKPGDIFCAVPGEKVDGRTFIRVAAARGAAGSMRLKRASVLNTIRCPLSLWSTCASGSAKSPRAFTMNPRLT